METTIYSEIIEQRPGDGQTQEEDGHVETVEVQDQQIIEQQENVVHVDQQTWPQSGESETIYIIDASGGPEYVKQTQMREVVDPVDYIAEKISEEMAELRTVDSSFMRTDKESIASLTPQLLLDELESKCPTLSKILEKTLAGPGIPEIPDPMKQVSIVATWLNAQFSKTRAWQIRNSILLVNKNVPLKAMGTLKDMYVTVKQADLISYIHQFGTEFSGKIEGWTAVELDDYVPEPEEPEKIVEPEPEPSKDIQMANAVQKIFQAGLSGVQSSSSDGNITVPVKPLQTIYAEMQKMNTESFAPDVSSEADLPVLELLEVSSEPKDQTEKLALRTYRCKLCQVMFTNDAELMQHQNSKHQDMFCCRECNFVSPIKSRLTRHKRVHHSNVENCPECDFKTPKKAVLEKHMLLHKGPIKHICSICKLACTTLNSLQHHMRRHKDPRMQCYICPRRFCNFGEMKNHLKIHDGNHLCEFCQMPFAKQCHLENHIFSEHQNITKTASGLSNNACKYCVMITKNTVEMNRHMLRSHSDQCVVKGTKCNMCYYRSESAEELAAHEEEHRKEGWCQCEYCKVIFFGEPGLARHQSTAHALEIAKATGSHTAKVVVEYQPSKGRVYKCSDCSYTNGQRWAVENHAVCHAGDNLVTCSHCQAQFRDISIDYHIKTIHPAEWRKDAKTRQHSKGASKKFQFQSMQSLLQHYTAGAVERKQQQNAVMKAFSNLKSAVGTPEATKRPAETSDDSPPEKSVKLGPENEANVSKSPNGEMNENQQ